jgi:hypothetical protein
MTSALLIEAPTPPLARPRRLLLAALALVAALLVLQVEGLTPRLLPREAAPTAGATAPSPDAAAAAGAARAARVGPAAEPGVLEARDPSYQALFDADGFSYRPAGATAPLRVDLSAVTVGGRSVELDLGRWAADGSVLERPVGPSLTERVTARDGEVEWDVVLDRALPGSGDLLVRGDLSGTAGDAIVKDGALLVPLTGGSVTRVGEVVVKDAGGAVLHRALPLVSGDSIELVVPASALNGARYPVTVDPTVGAAKTLATNGNRFEPAIAYSGGADATHLVVWQEFVAGKWDIYGAVITEDGVGSTHPKRISTGTESEFRPDVAWNGSNYLVVFEEQYPPSPSDVDIRGQLVDKNGNLVGGNIGIVTPGTGQGQPAITSTSTGFVVAWNDNRNGNWDIYAGRYTSAGVAQDGTGKRISNDASPFIHDDFYPDVAWNGSWSMIVWQEFVVDSYSLNTQRFHPNGEPDAGCCNGSFRIGYHHQRASIASNGDRFFVVFEEKQVSTGATDIWAINLTANNFHDGAFPVSQQAVGNESDPGVAYSSAGYLVTLTDRRFTGDPDVRAVRYNSAGTRLDGDTFVIEGATNENDQPAVSPGRGGGWAVGYEDGTGPQTAIRWRHAK